MIIGLCGKAGAGKSEVCRVLEDNWRYETLAFADPLYEAVAAITGLTISEMKDRSRKESVIPWIGKSPRELLQTLGTEWGRNLVHPELWVMRCMNRCFGRKNVAICDVRFDNEATAIRRNGGVVWLVTRGVAGLSGEAATHASEAGVSPELIHAVIRNDGSLTDLEDAVDGNMIARLGAEKFAECARNIGR